MTIPTTDLPADTHPIGAALTVAFGSNDRPFCSLGDLYRILGYLRGDVPGHDGIDDAIDECQQHVAAALPDSIAAFGEPADFVWVTSIANKYGATIVLSPLPDTTR
jgi:hypothetical protein